MRFRALGDCEGDSGATKFVTKWLLISFVRSRRGLDFSIQGFRRVGV